MTRWVRWNLEVTVMEDLQAGSGFGTAEIDSLLPRDAFGLPVIRWSHLKGLLAQARRDRAIELGEAPERDGLAAELFGRPGSDGDGRGSMRGTSLRVRGSAERIGSLVWSSTARRPGTRVPDDETLRQVEHIPAGTTFVSEIRLRLSGEETRDANRIESTDNLLRRVNRLGADRTRGDGLIMTRVRKEEMSFACAPSPRASSTSGRPVGPVDLAVGKVYPDSFRILLVAVEPICAAAVGEPGNVTPTYSHLPPSVVTGALARFALEVGCTDIAEALLGGRVVPGPAYPMPFGASEGAVPAQLDAVPIPLGLKARKPLAPEARWPWWGMGDPVPQASREDASAKSSGDEKLKRPGPHEYLFTRDGGNSWHRFTCPIGLSMRNNAGASALPDAGQQLFALQEIEEGTAFVCSVMAAPEIAGRLAEFFDALRTGTHWLSVGVGGQPVKVVACHSSESPFRTRQDSMPGSAASNKIDVFVETDLILRTGDFGFHASLSRSAAEDLLRLAGAEDALCRQLTGVDSTADAVEVRGRNFATAAQRLPAIAIRRGSCATLSFETIDAARQVAELLAGVGAAGVGERADEGFGRLRLGFAPRIVPPAATFPELVVDLAESRRRKVAALLGEIPEGVFATLRASRWHELCSVARARPTMEPLLAEWKRSAARQLDRHESRRGSEHRWMDKLDPLDPETLLLFGKRAARRAGDRRDSDRRPSTGASA